MEHIGTRIAALRKKAGMSQEDLAKELNISRQSISKWESGQALPDIDKISAISTIFHVSTDHLIHGTETPSRKTCPWHRDDIAYGILTLAIFYIYFSWKEYQVLPKLMPGIIGLVLAVFLFTGKKRKKTIFYSIVGFIPVSFLATTLSNGFPSPIPMFLRSYIVFFIVYIAYVVLVKKYFNKNK